MTETRSSPHQAIAGFERISGHQQVVDWFGCWPSFHDAEVHRLSLRRDAVTGVGTAIEIDLHGWLLKQGANGFLEASQRALVSFLFEGVSDVHLEGFNSQNVITALHVTSDDSKIRVELEHCYLFECHFVAQSGRVTHLRPLTVT